MEQPISVNNKLIEILESHNVEFSSEKDGWIVFPKRSIIAQSGQTYLVRSPKLAGQIVNESQHPTFVNVQLDILVELLDRRILIESFAGIGNNQEEAIEDSLQNFLLNSFHVLLNAFYDIKDEHTTEDDWRINDKDWKAIIGGFVVKTFGEISIQVPDEAFLTFENLIRNQELKQDIHWFRLFYAQQNRRLLDCETLYDNEVWEEASKELVQLNWENIEDYYSVRNFLVLKNESYGKFKNYSELTDLIIKGVEVFRDNPRAEEEFLLANLIKQEIDEETAISLITFIPIAFTRVGLEHLNINFQDYFQLVNRKGSVVRKTKLLDVPIYGEALRFAKEDSALFLDNDEFLAIESYNVEFKIVNNMLNEGSRVEDIFISPVTMPAEDGIEEVLENKKSWWQIWK